MIKTIITKKHFCDIQPPAVDSRAWGGAYLEYSNLRTIFLIERHNIRIT